MLERRDLKGNPLLQAREDLGPRGSLCLQRFVFENSVNVNVIVSRFGLGLKNLTSFSAIRYKIET